MIYRYAQSLFQLGLPAFQGLVLTRIDKVETDTIKRVAGDIERGHRLVYRMQSSKPAKIGIIEGLNTHRNARNAPIAICGEPGGLNGPRICLQCNFKIVCDGPKTLDVLNHCGNGIWIHQAWRAAAKKNGRENLCPTRQIISMPPREGAFAQFIAMPDSNLVTVPDTVSLSKAALAEPLAVSWHAARLALAALHPAMERRALVIGGGAIGLAAALALNAMGIEDVTITEPNDARRAYLAECCGQQVVTQAQGAYPLIIDAVGYATTRATASALTQPGGVMAHVGLGEDAGGLDIRRMTLHEITFVGTYTYTAQDFRDTAQAIFDGRLGPLDWIEERPLSDGNAAFQDLRAGKVAAPKIVLSPWT